VHSAHVFSTLFFAARWRCHRLIVARVVIQSTDFDKIFDCLFFAAMCLLKIIKIGSSYKKTKVTF